MSLDTKYRPLRFSDVLGQEGTIKILRRYVATGAGMYQSYLFAGPFGSGKTTLGRILARSLLCTSPTPEGDACDKCENCVSLLENGVALDFIEVDAATNSGKDEIRKINEEISYDSFTGKRRIYLFDEAHQLSRDALDALLKPLEENVPGTQDKRLVCIFCTTEPEKMRATILSRCAPVFVIRPVSPVEIAARLEYVCKQENIEYDPEMLKLIAEMVECHIRDALKAIEGVSLLGPVNKENVSAYLHLDLNAAYLAALENIGTDLGAALEALKSVLDRTSPVTCYEKLAEISMLAFQMTLGVKPPIFWDAERLKAVGEKHRENLLGFASRFSSRPGRPTAAMLFCDVGHLHHVGGAVLGSQPVVMLAQAAPVGYPAVAPPPALSPISSGGEAPATPVTPAPTAPVASPPVKSAANSGRLPEDVKVGEASVRYDLRAVKKIGNEDEQKVAINHATKELSPSVFCELLALKISELDGMGSGSTRRPYVDSNRTDVSGGGQG